MTSEAEDSEPQTAEDAIAEDALGHIAVEGPVVESPGLAVLSRPALAVVTTALLGGVLQLVPGLEALTFLSRPEPEPVEDIGLLNLSEQREGASELPETHFRPELQEQAGQAPAARGPIAETQTDFEVPEVDADAPPVPIEDARRSMDKFYASLTKTAAKHPGAITRILYHGDSLVASDYVTNTVRRKLQRQFGDAGHGFVVMADPWPAYFHNDIFRFASRGFQVSRVVGPYIPDGMYGVGGVSFKAPPGVRARFGTMEKGEFGRNVSLFQLLYLKQPHGGQLKINVDGKPHTVIDTAAEEKSSGVFSVEVEDGHHLFEVVTAGAFTRTFGVVLERKVPGVVLDAIGIQGARLRFLDKQDDAHWAEQLQLRQPNLIVYQFGANESGDGFAYSMEDYHRTMAEVLNQAMRAVPDAGCLVMAAMDRARKQGDYLITVPIIPHIVKEQEAVAKEVGCAFWSTYEAMGGNGSMANWVRRGIAQADMTHPTGYGAQILGNWVFQALMQGYNDYQKRRAQGAVAAPAADREEGPPGTPPVESGSGPPAAAPDAP